MTLEEKKTARIEKAAPQLLVALKWAIDHVEDDLDPDHQLAKAAAEALISTLEAPHPCMIYVAKGTEGGSYPLQDILQFQIHGDTFRAWKPSRDESGRVAWVKPLNTGLAYGITHEGRFALCDTRTLSDWVNRVLSEHDTPEAMRAAFYEEKENREL